MQAHIAGAYQRGLEDEEKHPAGKDDGMDGEDEGWNGRGVEQVFSDGVAEAVDRYDGDQQRHTEVEVLAQESHRPCMVAREGRGHGRHHELLIGPGVLLVFVVREY